MFLLAWFVAACRPIPSVPSAPAPLSTPPFQRITVTQLAAMLEHKDFFLLNVHTPYAGEIDGTDLFLHYDRVGEHPELLPPDKSTTIVVYCHSGTMSNMVGKVLVGMGYTNVLDLQGGMVMWEQAGYERIRVTPARSIVQ
jgi:rhodanese-related sulfurtransferase